MMYSFFTSWFNPWSRIKAVIFVLCLGATPMCSAMGPDMFMGGGNIEAMMFYVELQKVQGVVTDDETKLFLQSIMDDLSLRNDKEVSIKLAQIFKRIDYFQQLLEQVDKITHEGTKQEVDRLIANQPLLDDPVEQANAERLILRSKWMSYLESISWRLDEVTKGLVQGWIDDPVQLDDLRVQNAASLIVRRLDLMKSLERAMARIPEEETETRETIQALLDDQILLDDADMRERAEMIIFRVRTIPLLEQLLEKELVKRKGDAELVQSWIDNPTLLHNPEILEKVQDVIKWAVQGPVLRQIKTLQTSKDVGILAYSVYRKFSTLHAFDTGKLRGWGGWILDVLASGAHLGTDIGSIMLSLFKQLTPEQQQLPLLQKLQLVLPSLGQMVESGQLEQMLSGWKDKSAWMMRDDLTGYAKLSPTFTDNWLTTRLNANASADVRREILGDQRVGEINRLQQQTNEIMNKRRYKRKAYNKFVGQHISQNGCPGFSIELFNAFDFYLDNILEKKVDEMLQKCKIPSILRTTFWGNKLVKHVRTSAVFKVLPTLAYYGVKNKGFDGMSKWIPCREVVKSIDSAIRYDILHSTYRYLNKFKDAQGVSYLRHVKNKTLGLIRPGLLKFALKMTTPFLTIKVANQVNEKIGDTTGRQFLIPQDVHPGFPYRENSVDDEAFGKEKAYWVAKKVISHAGRSIFFFFLLRFMQKFRPKVVSWLGDKVGKFLNFLARRNIIDPFTRQLAGFAGSSVNMKLLPLCAGLFLDKSATLTDFEKYEMWDELAKTKDEMCMLDYLLSAVIATWLSGETASWAVGKIREGFAT